jgi:hypothetical protein
MSESVRSNFREFFIGLLPFLLILLVGVYAPSAASADLISVRWVCVSSLSISLICACIYGVRTYRNRRRAGHYINSSDFLNWGITLALGSNVPLLRPVSLLLFVAGSVLCATAVVVSVRNVYMTSDKFIVS